MSDFIQTFEARMAEDRNLKKLYLEERLFLEVTNIISELMEEQGLRRTDLAERVDCTKGYITNLLDGTKNMTLKTISNVLFELGHVLSVKAVQVNENSRKEVFEGTWEKPKIRFVMTNPPGFFWSHSGSNQGTERIPA